MAWSKNMTWDNYFTTPKGFIDLYLKKLGVTRQQPSRTYLDELVRQQQCVLPFENLNTTDLNQPVPIDPQSLMDKLLLQHRGGFCFELNGAFSILLKALGFNAWLCPGRQLRHTETSPVPATHCAILVYLDKQTYFVDVGYGGPMPFGSIAFKPNTRQTVAHEDFYFQPSGLDQATPPEQSGWYTLLRRSQTTGAKLPLIQMAPIQQYLCDFYGQAMLRAAGASAYAVRHVALRYPDGYADLTGTTLKVQHAGHRVVTQVAVQDLPAVLQQYFTIQL